jgi:hypothetical protein
LKKGEDKGLHVRNSPPQNSSRERIMGCKPEIHLHRIEREGEGAARQQFTSSEFK